MVNATLTDGIAKGDPLLAMRDRELELLARGTVALPTLALDLAVVSHARRGLGISIGDLVRPFVRIGGTLAAPKLVGDPGRGIITTGLHMLSSGGTLVLGKLGRRLTDRNVCDQALGAAGGS